MSNINNRNQNRKNPRNTGGRQQSKAQDTAAGKFQLDLSDEDIATGPIDMPAARRREQYPAENMSSKKIYYTEKERKKEAKAHRKRNRVKAGKNKRVFSIMWIVMVLLVSFTLASYLISGSNDFLAIDRTVSNIVEVTIPENVTEDQLAEILAEKGVINKTEFFSLYCKLTADMEYFRAGTFSIDTNLDYEDIINKLQSGITREVEKLTFTEGMNAVDIANILEENGICGAEEALEAMNTENFSNYQCIADLTNEADRYYVLEGYLFPDTYQFYKEENVKSVLGKMLNNFQSKTNEFEAKIASSGMTRDQVIVLASIIQREAANEQDMYKVSAVLHNRLDWGADHGIYNLQCDATKFYPYKTRNDIPESIRDTYTSDYDTDVVQGLPAGAICSPGFAAINAALNPDKDSSEYLYFCHGSDGTAYYARTMEEHNENLVLAGLV